MNLNKFLLGIRSLWHTRFKILAYHGVVKDAPDLYEVSAESFQEQMQIISDQGFSVIGLETAVAMMNDRLLPPKSIVITFDDAHTSIIENALPILSDFKYPATIFVPTGLVGQEDTFSDEFPNSKYIMNWEQLKGLCKNGIHLGSHSVNHCNLTTLGLSDLRTEIHASYTALIENIGQHTYFFAYPFGLLNNTVKQVVSASKFKGALCFGSVLSNWEETDVFELKREKILSNTDYQSFKCLINPGNDLVRGIKAYAGKTFKPKV